MIYGIGVQALAEQLAVSEDEASVFMESFKAKFTGDCSGCVCVCGLMIDKRLQWVCVCVV